MSTPRDLDKQKEAFMLHQRLVQARTCRICKRNKVNLLTLPCRALVTCRKCGDSLTHCPKCHVLIVATVNVYF